MSRARSVICPISTRAIAIDARDRKSTIADAREASIALFRSAGAVASSHAREGATELGRDKRSHRFSIGFWLGCRCGASRRGIARKLER
jgi:hypothetical protein